MKGYGLNNEAYIKRMINACNSNGVKINLKNPRTIQDKLCWLNIYDINPLKVKCADKILVRDYCKEVIGKDICIPLIGIYEKSDDIKWNELPKQFVIKCNHGSGMNIIVKDKAQTDFSKVTELLDRWLAVDFTFQNGFESHYHAIERKILIEEFVNDGHQSLYDYKFWCFNGKPIYYTINDGNGHGKWMKYYDMNQNELTKFKRLDFNGEPNHKVEQPSSFKIMKDYAEKLCNPFKFVRVDFYEINGKPYLGELTFTPGAMLFRQITNEQDIEIGNMLTI